MISWYHNLAGNIGTLDEQKNFNVNGWTGTKKKGITQLETKTGYSHSSNHNVHVDVKFVTEYIGSGCSSKPENTTQKYLSLQNATKPRMSSTRKGAWLNPSYPKVNQFDTKTSHLGHPENAFPVRKPFQLQWLQLVE